MRPVLFTATLFALLAPFAASAQTFGGLGSIPGNTFTVSVSPQYPSPNSIATLSFLSDTLDLTRVSARVLVGGKEVYKGTVHPVSVALGKAGSVTSVRAILSADGTSYSQTLTLQPQDAALIAEPLSSTPPLYPGKSFVPFDGDARVVAVVNLKNTSGVLANPTTDSYAWSVDGVQIASASGIGKSSLMVSSPLQYRSREVSVVVTSANGALVGGDTLTLSGVDPLVRIYESDPLLGIRFDHALLAPFNIGGAEATLYAAPFSLATTAGSPSISWFLNGSPAQTGPLVTLRPTGGGQGSATLSVTASSGETSATGSLSLIFGVQKSTNLFGL